ncbi:MAG: tRNA pseudouridine(38-40) synthase TruA [Halioglobus sp.]
MIRSPHHFSSDPIPAGTRVACGIEYDGSRYNGWQAQSQSQLSVITVQQQLEQALLAVAVEPVRVQCAGRTDTGVHGYEQVVHFDAPVARSSKSWVLGANANLPFDVRVHWAVPVPPSFHARFAALSRRYRYIIANTPVRPALLASQVTWQRRQLDVPLMHSEAQCLLGEQDFSAFRAASCQSSSPMRNVHFLEVYRRGSLIVIDIQANAFLHHMVRNIAGSLMAVGTGRQAPGWLQSVMLGRDRTLAADTAPADGLYFVRANYPPEYTLPDSPLGPMMLIDS